MNDLPLKAITKAGSIQFRYKSATFSRFSVGPHPPLPIRLFLPLLSALVAVGMPGLSIPSTSLATGRFIFGRYDLRPRLLRLAAVRSLLWRFRLGGRLRTELAPRQTFPATGTPGNLLLRCGLSHPRRPSEAERLEQVKVVLRVLMSTDLLSYPIVLLGVISLKRIPWSPGHGAVWSKPPVKISVGMPSGNALHVSSPYFWWTQSRH